MSFVGRHWLSVFSLSIGFLLCLFLFIPKNVMAANIMYYSDTISDSGPNEQSNHTLSFTINTDVSSGGYIEVTPPSGFTTVSTSTFAERNVELIVNGVTRTSGTSTSPGVDMVEIITGSPGLIRYTLAPDFTITSGSHLELRIGNHTSESLQFSMTYSTSTGTTTTPADIEPITNSSDLGVHYVRVEVYDGVLVADKNFIIFLNQKINIPNVDTTETVPPFRFNPSPTTTIGGTTLSVEISLETDELAVCKFDYAAGTNYYSMPHTFSNTGMIFHSQVVAVVRNSLNTIYVRCIDDEGNYNIDDFLIQFYVNDTPTGQANTEGDEEGDGTGEGDVNTGTGDGSGGESGEADGEEPLEGGDEGEGGSGGGGGGGSGEDDGITSGGGFEDDDAPYESGDGRVIISGYAYPDSEVTFLVDGNYFDTTDTNNLGVYSVTLDEIASGVYTFGVYAEDPRGIMSSTFSTSFTVTGARTTALSNINVSPSILVEPDPVDPGDTVVISGYGLPNSNITIENGRINSSASTLTTTADSGGEWSLAVNTTGFTTDTYQVRAKSEQVGGKSTSYSDYTYYGVGQEADQPISADLNVDGSVNLIDFSILLYWWNSDGGNSNPPADINRDGNVSLTDFSIMLFNWTG